MIFLYREELFSSSTIWLAQVLFQVGKDRRDAWDFCLIYTFSEKWVDTLATSMVINDFFCCLFLKYHYELISFHISDKFQLIVVIMIYDPQIVPSLSPWSAYKLDLLFKSQITRNWVKIGYSGDETLTSILVSFVWVTQTLKKIIVKALAKIKNYEDAY